MKSKPITAKMVKQQSLLELTTIPEFPYPHDIRDDQHYLNVMRVCGLLPAYNASHDAIGVDEFICKSF